MAKELKWVLVDKGTNQVKGFVHGDVSSVPPPPVQEYIPLPENVEFPIFEGNGRMEHYKYENGAFIYVEEFYQQYYKKNFRRLRQSSYPQIGDQLDALFHAGVFPPEMAEQIQAIKDKYPKPEINN